VIVVDGPDGLLAQTLARLRDLESRWSRFLADSEVSRLNAAIAHGDEPPALSADTLLLLERAAEGFRITNGRFDATRLGAVAAAGYERSLERYGPTVAGIAGRVPIVGFDPGGIGKGLAADIVSRELVDAGATGALVSIGGDLRVRGTAPDGGSWRIDIEDPRDGSILTAVTLDDGAVATSSQLKRRWTATDGTVRHHLIDPATGVPSQSPVLSATVIAGEAWQAEVLTKVAFLDAFGDGALSDDAGLDLVERLSTAALVVTPDLVLTTSRWHRFEQSPTGRDRAGV
jgi:thiamine biosynthesis lipoprotein